MRQTLILLAGIFALCATSFPLANAQSKQEAFGKCAYFADALHGRKTASGELYDKTLLTAAHKTLPFGTNIRVTRLDNKKSVVVRVNDRGPFMDGYVVDISRKAAEAIGLIRDGVTKVKIEVVESKSSTVQPTTYSTPTAAPGTTPTTHATASRVASASDATTQLVKPKKSGTTTTDATTSVAPLAYSSSASPQPQVVPMQASAPTIKVAEVYQIEIKSVQSKSFGLQLAVLSNSENLFQEISRLQATWPGKVIMSHEANGAAATFKLILGPFATRKDAEAQQKKAATKGYKKTFVVEFE